MKNVLILMSLLLIAVLTGCKKSNDEPATGTAKGVIKNASSSAVITDARISIFDANTNSPAAGSTVTVKDGSYSFNLLHGKLTKLLRHFVRPEDTVVYSLSNV